MKPDSKRTNIHLYLIGLRNIESLINGIEPNKCYLTFDVSGDEDEGNKLNANETEPISIKYNGTIINDLKEIMINVPKN